MTVAFANGTVTASISGSSFSAGQCDLAGGSQTATVTATDSTNLSSDTLVNFTIDAGKTGNYNYHINEGHITWGYGYSECYIEFGTADFTMREYQAGSSQCNWIADGAPSCKGPNQACQTPTQNPDSDNDGVNDSVDNCPNDANSDQADNDNDGIGNVCDSTPNGNNNDADQDGVTDNLDNCPNDANPSQTDTDSDGLGDVCDPTPNGDYQCTQVTSNNYQHVTAGRATYSYGYALAVGSGDNLGYYNTYVITTLAQTSAGYYEEGNCP